MSILQCGSRAALLVALAATACLLTGCEKPPAPIAEGPRPVKLLEVGGGGSAGTREYPGRIKAGQYSELGFEVPGKVVEFAFREGAEVKAGAVLAKLDPSDYRARYDASVAKMQHARAERDRYSEMYKKEVKAYSEYEMRLRSYEVAAAETRQAKKALEDTVLRAPFDGVMARKLVEPFESVAAKLPVLVLQNDRMLEIKVSVPERDLAAGRDARRTGEELNRELRPRVTVSSLPGREFPARIKELANVADETTRTFEATLLFENPPDANILGGMTAKVTVDLPALPASAEMLVPARAVVAGAGGGASVWVIEPAAMTASSRAVEVGELRGDMLPIVAGLTAGELVAVSGVHQLRDGMTVRRFER